MPDLHAYWSLAKSAAKIQYCRTVGKAALQGGGPLGGISGSGWP